ncbi:MAG: tetratricopeptide repeat protein, partial [Candidatus Aminicenantes bacterium]|nr:tetratricopeptide repeat protein [Candidatus Aminicenantes bacterium]
YLADKGAKPEIQDAQRMTPLHIAAMNNNLNVVNALLKRGAATETRDGYERTALILCARERGGAATGRVLIEAGADVNAADKFGSTALELAAWRGKAEFVDLLLERGARVPDSGEPWQAMLSQAASNGLANLFRRLADKSQDMKAVDLSGSWLLQAAAAGWSEPQLLDPGINAMNMHWQFSLDRERNLYFAGRSPDSLGLQDIYMARFVDGNYEKPVNPGQPINSKAGDETPFIAPDGSYLLFARQFDLWVSFRGADGAWSEPVRLGPEVNSPSIELCPIVTADGQYLFFLSQRDGESHAYWVRADVIEKLRPEKRQKPNGHVQAGRDQEGSPLSVGTLRKLRSEILKEDRLLSIRLPDDYGRARLSYPVIYLLYGDQTEGYFAETIFSLGRLEGGAEIPEFILVGVHNTDRYGDLLPCRPDGSPGGADTFMDFLEKELFPFVETEYRAKPFRLLIGPQAGATFGLYSLGRRPGLFNAYILENPFWSSENCRQAIKSGLGEYAAAAPRDIRSVFISTIDRAGFQDHSEATKALLDFLREFEPLRPAGMRIWRRHIEEPTFVPLLELIRPFRAIFAGFSPPADAAMNNLAEIQAYYREVGRRFGFEVDPPAFFLAVKSDEFSRAGRTAAAREILEYSLTLRPEETNAAFRLANLFFAEWDLDGAEAIFRKLQSGRPDPFFVSRLEAIERMRRGSAALALSRALNEGLPAAEARLAELEKGRASGIYFDEREFNVLGYRLLAQGRTDQAVFVCEANARRYPASWNAHDSLGEAYMKSGRNKDAVRSYERSLSLNPKNDNAKKMLEALRRER